MNIITSVCFVAFFMLVGSLKTNGEIKKVELNNITMRSFESRLEEVNKVAIVYITNGDFQSSPEWNGVDLSKIPVTMESAVEISIDQLKKWGCDPQRYILVKCSLVREIRDKDQFKWYWSVSYVDSGLRMLNAKPVVSIPILFTGKVPEKIELSNIDE